MNGLTVWIESFQLRLKYLYNYDPTSPEKCIIIIQLKSKKSALNLPIGLTGDNLSIKAKEFIRSACHLLKKVGSYLKAFQKSRQRKLIFGDQIA